MKDLTEADAHSTPITVPEGADSRSDAAEVVEAIAQKLANRTNRLNLHAAFKNAVNTFTETQAIDVVSNIVPMLNSTKVSSDGGVGARAKLLAEFQCNNVAGDNRQVRIYWGADPNARYGWIFTINANYQTSDDRWHADDSDFASSALLLGSNGILSSIVIAATVPWTNWPTDTGLVEGVGAFDTLLVVNGATIPDIVGSTRVSADAFADNFIAGVAFDYETPPTRQRLLDLFDSFGDGLVSFGGGTFHVVLVTAGDTHLWPIRLPHGAQLTRIEALFNKPGTTGTNVRLYKKSSFDWTPAVTMPSDTLITSGTALASGDQVSASGPLTETIDNNANQYFIAITSGDNDETVYGLRVTFVDPGPRNH